MNRLLFCLLLVFVPATMLGQTLIFNDSFTYGDGRLDSTTTNWVKYLGQDSTNASLWVTSNKIKAYATFADTNRAKRHGGLMVASSGTPLRMRMDSAEIRLAIPSMGGSQGNLGDVTYRIYVVNGTNRSTWQGYCLCVYPWNGTTDAFYSLRRVNGTTETTLTLHYPDDAYTGERYVGLASVINNPLNRAIAANDSIVWKLQGTKFYINWATTPFDTVTSATYRNTTNDSAYVAVQLGLVSGAVPTADNFRIYATYGVTGPTNTSPQIVSALMSQNVDTLLNPIVFTYVLHDAEGLDSAHFNFGLGTYPLVGRYNLLKRIDTTLVINIGRQSVPGTYGKSLTVWDDSVATSPSTAVVSEGLVTFSIGVPSSSQNQPERISGGDNFDRTDGSLTGKWAPASNSGTDGTWVISGNAITPSGGSSGWGSIVRDSAINQTNRYGFSFTLAQDIKHDTGSFAPVLYVPFKLATKDFGGKGYVLACYASNSGYSDTTVWRFYIWGLRNWSTVSWDGAFTASHAFPTGAILKFRVDTSAALLANMFKLWINTDSLGFALDTVSRGDATVGSPIRSYPSYNGLRGAIKTPALKIDNWVEYRYDAAPTDQQSPVVQQISVVGKTWPAFTYQADSLYPVIVVSDDYGIQKILWLHKGVRTDSVSFGGGVRSYSWADSSHRWLASTLGQDTISVIVTEDSGKTGVGSLAFTVIAHVYPKPVFSGLAVSPSGTIDTTTATTVSGTVAVSEGYLDSTAHYEKDGAGSWFQKAITRHAPNTVSNYTYTSAPATTYTNYKNQAIQWYLKSWTNHAQVDSSETKSFQVYPASGSTTGGYVTGYWPTWSDPMTPTNANWTGMTHVIYFTLSPVQTAPYVNVLVTPADSSAWEAPNGVSGYMAGVITQAHAHGVKALMCIGGIYGTQATNMNYICSDSTRTDLYAVSVVALAKRKGYDGIDVDWEPPQNKTNNMMLLRLLKRELNKGMTYVSKGLLTIACPTGSTASYDTAWCNANVDQMNLMEYDYYQIGSGICAPCAQDEAGFNAPLYRPGVKYGAFMHNNQHNLNGDEPNAQISPGTPANPSHGIRKYLAAGFKPSILAIGLPFYAYVFNQVPNIGVRLDTSGTRSNNNYTYYKYVIAALNAGGLTRYWDDTSKVPYLLGNSNYSVWPWNNGNPITCTYDDTASIGLKVDFAKSLGVNIMLYDLASGWVPGANPVDPLLRTAVTHFNTSAVTTPVPDVPVVTTPVNNSTGVSRTPTIAWNSSTYASTYLYQLASNLSFSIIIDSLTTPLLQRTVPSNLTLNYSTKYYARVLASNSTGPSSWSAVDSFTTIPQAVSAPEAFTVAFPAANVTGLTVPVDFSWNASTGAASYNLVLARDTMGSTQSFGTLNTSYRVPSGLSPNTSYWWHVVAANDIGYYITAWRKFTMSAQAQYLPPFTQMFYDSLNHGWTTAVQVQVGGITYWKFPDGHLVPLPTQ